MSEGIQNVIFTEYLGGSGVTTHWTDWAEFTLSLRIDLYWRKKIIYACVVFFFFLLKLALPAFPHNKHTTYILHNWLLLDRHTAQCKNTQTHNLSGSLTQLRVHIVELCIFVILAGFWTSPTAIGAVTWIATLCHRLQLANWRYWVFSRRAYCIYADAECRETLAHTQTRLSHSHYAYSHSQTLQKTPHTWQLYHLLT